MAVVIPVYRRLHPYRRHYRHLLESYSPCDRRAAVMTQKINIQPLWSDDGLLCLYTGGHVDNSAFITKILCDDDLIKILKDHQPDFERTTRNMTANSYHHYWRELTQAEQTEIGVEGMYDKFYDWCDASCDQAFPVTCLCFDI